MAITVQHTPANYTSVHGDVIFVVCDIVKASDATTYPDYRYVCDIYVGATMVTRLKAYPLPDNKMGVFNVGNVLRSYLTTTFNPTASVVQAQQMGVDSFYVAATMKFGEEYEIAGVMTLTTNITVDTERAFYNHYDGRLLGVTTNLNAIINAPATQRLVHNVFQTYSEGYPVYTSNKNSFVPFIPSTSAAVTLRITSFTDAGSQVATQDVSVNPSAANVLQSYNLSPTVLNTLYPGLIPLTVASYYTVEFRGAAAQDKTLRFNLVCEPKYEVFTVHFLNRYGGFESRDFTKVSRKVIDIERNEFGKLGYTLDSSGVVTYKNSNNVYNETRSVYSTQYKEKLSLNTDVLTDSEYTWLGDLILSPMVYVEQTDISGNLYHVPCVIEENNYEFKKRINDKMTNLTIKISYGEVFNSQYR